MADDDAAGAVGEQAAIDYARDEVDAAFEVHWVGNGVELAVEEAKKLATLGKA